MYFVRSMIQFMHKSAKSGAKGKAHSYTVGLFVVLLVELEGSSFGGPD